LTEYAEVIIQLKQPTGSRRVRLARESRRQIQADSHTQHSRSALDARSCPLQWHISINQHKQCTLYNISIYF